MSINLPLFCIRHGLAAGVSSSIYNIISGLVQNNMDVDLYFTSLRRLSPDFVSSLPKSGISRHQFPEIPGGMASRFIEEALYAPFIRRDAPTVFPNYFLPLLPRRKANVGVVIHDCQHRTLTDNFSAKKRAWLDFHFNRALNSADRTLLISEFEKQQILKYFGQKHEERCRVVYNAINWRRYESDPTDSFIQRLPNIPFILGVADQYVHKQTRLLIDAFVLFSKREPDFNLVLAGKASARIAEYVQSLPDDGLKGKVILTGFITDGDLGYLYRQAKLFVTPSAYEGFGMPAVEAMGSGLETLVSDTTALPEVTLGKANYCAPDSPREVWAERIFEIISHPRPEDERLSLAQEIRTKYSPAAIAKSYLAALN